MLKRFATRALCSAALLAAPLLVAQPAVADGAKTPREAAVCDGLLNAFFGRAPGFTQQNVNAVCTVRMNGGTGGTSN
ncbi:hypothetical protein [Kitasatospora sp. HPMI-4]|uniref:hypothetical protein n=1 Tax=Kitasatospora sp. HPMI-4 TaxID=3448443 RepID=UPI003F1A4A1A